MLVHTYASGAKNRHSEVHKDPSTGDFEVRHYQAGQHVKSKKVGSSNDAHALAKSYISEDINFHGMAAKDHKDMATKTGNQRHDDAATEHLLAAELFKRNDHANAKKQAAKANRFSAALKEDAPVNNVGSGAVAGMGVGPQGEPGRRSRVMKIIRRNKTVKD